MKKLKLVESFEMDAYGASGRVTVRVHVKSSTPTSSATSHGNGSPPAR
jgi:hypothetical protein